MQYSKGFMKSHLYMMEVILLYIVLHLLYIHLDFLPPIIPFVMIAGIGGVVFVFLLSLMKNNTPYLFIMLFVPLLALLSSEFGYGFGLSFVLSAIICWRTIAHYRGTSKLSDAIILNITLGGGFLVYLAAAVQGYPLRDTVLYLIITQLLFFMIGKVVNGVVSSSLSNKEGELKKQSWSLLGLFSGLLVGAVLLAVTFPFIVSKLLSLVLAVLGKGLYYASIPLFNAIDGMEYERSPSGGGTDGQWWDKALEDRGSLWDWLYALAKVNIWVVLAVLGLIVLAIFAIILAKKKFVKSSVEENESYQYSIATDKIKGVESKWFSSKKKAPHAKVRKLVYELEILAHSKGKGRLASETVEEWLSRNSFLEKRLVDCYEKVRYGEEDLTEEENKMCDEIVKSLKDNLRSLKKNKY